MSEPGQPSDQAPADDVDRLFLRGLERAAVPQDFTSRVLASTVGRSEATRTVFAWPWLMAGLVALGLLTLAGYQVGARVAMADGLDLLAAVLQDVGLVSSAPGDVLAAVGELVPWWLFVLGGVSAGLLVVATNRLVSHAPRPVRARVSG